jgi:transcriptional regulator with XRE-family HTH domain
MVTPEQKLQWFRETNDLSQSEVAAHLFMCRETYSKTENGHRDLRSSEIAAAAELFGVQPGEFF